VLDDPRVHSADVHLLPGPGEIQDPIDDGSPISSDAGTTAVLVRLSDHLIYSSDVGILIPDGGIAGFTMFADGTCGYIRTEPSPTEGLFANEWINTAPVELSVASLYEVYAQQGEAGDMLGTDVTLTGDSVNTWLPMSSDRYWQVERTGTAYSAAYTYQLRVKIRRIGSTVILADRRISLFLYTGPETP
jgi:hypothetical protein